MVGSDSGLNLFLFSFQPVSFVFVYFQFFLVFAYNPITLHSSVRTYHALCILLLRFLLSFLISPSLTHVIFL